MKKLFSLGTLFLIFTVLAACGATEPEMNEANITVNLNSDEGLISETITYDDTDDVTIIDVLETRFTLGYDDREDGTYLTRIGDLRVGPEVNLEVYLNDTLVETSLDDVAFEDGDVFTFRRVWFEGENRLTVRFDTSRGIMEEAFLFETGTEDTVFDMLQAAYELEYGLFDDFVFLRELAHINPTHGSFIETSRNGFTLETSIDQIGFSDGDVFTFKHTWFLAGPKLVYEALELFIDEQLEAFITETPSYPIFMALYHLDMLDAYDFEPMPIDDDFTTGDFVKNILIANGLDIDYEAYQTGLLEIAELVHPYTDSMVVITLSGYEPAADFIQDYLTNIADKPLEEMDYDTLSIVYIALDILDENPELKSEIRLKLLDAPYEHTYGYNAATLAQMLLVFHTYSDTPDLVVDGSNLLERLLNHQTASGGFVYELGDEDPDAFFTTPQAFFALAYTHAAYNKSEANPFAWE